MKPHQFPPLTNANALCQIIAFSGETCWNTPALLHAQRIPYPYTRILT